MGYGAKDVTLEVFESYLKKLLHVIDKLPALDREKAVMILRTSANRYYDLTLGATLQMTTSEYFAGASSSAQPCPDVASFQAASILDSTSSPFSPMVVPETVSMESPTKTASKLESDTILAEISDLAAAPHLGCLAADPDNTAESESWDRHLENTATSGVSHTGGNPTYVTPRCALCNRLFSSTKEVTDHYLPVSCIGCKKELCNKEIFAIHFNSCKGIKHYQSKLNSISAPQPPILTEQGSNSNEARLSKKQSYKCHQCSKVFVTAFQLNKHIKGHNDNNCDKCDAKFAKRKLLVNHLKTVHYISTAENYYVCKFCPRKFVKRPSLWAHYSEHTEGSQVVCLKCGDILEDKIEMEKHTLEHKTNARFTCEKCGEFFARKQQYLAHIVGHDKYNCKLCGKDFSSKKKLKYHKNLEHDSSSTNKPKVEKLLAANNQNFTCVVCLQNYKNETLFKAHDCSKDGKKSEKTKNIAKDVTIKLPSSKYKCRFCEFQHKKSSAVVRHARIHRNKKRFVCEQCGTAFSAHYTLKEHRIYVHSEDRKYPCTKCDKTFKARNALIRHEQVHSDKRPFACHCGQMFKRSTHLKRHVATSHKGETIVPSDNLPVSVSDKTWAEDPIDGNKFKSTWDSPNKFGIPASVALDVVTSLDLNMRTMDKDKITGKYDKEKVSQVHSGGSGDREPRDGSSGPPVSVYPHPDYRYGAAPQPAPGHASRYQHGHPDHQLGPAPATPSRYYPAPPLPRDKEFDVHEKLYLQHPSSQAGAAQDKLYLSPPVPSSSSLDTRYPLEDRGYTHGLVASRSCEAASHLGRSAVSAAANLEPLFSDSGPADLTMTRASMSAPSSRGEAQLSQYSRQGAAPPPPPPRHRYSGYSQHAAASTRAGSYPSHSYSLRLQDYSRPGTSHHVSGGPPPQRNMEAVSSALESLEDPYRPLSEISYSQRQQSHYFESLDTYLPHNREEMELSQCDKKKSYKTEKYYRSGDGDHQDVAGHREEGGLLPPLLALAPHHQQPHPAPAPPPASPHNIKLDYLCPTQTEQLASQYMQDGTLDYNNMTEY